jgi:hypothetical protein
MISLIVRRSRSSIASSFHCAQRHESNVACRSLNTKHLRSAPRIASSPQDAVRDVAHGSHVFVHSVAAAPQALIGGLMSRADELRDPANPVQIYHIHTEGPTPYCDIKVKDSFFTNVLFTAANTRDAVNDGRAAYIPCFLSEIPRLFLKGYVPLDVASTHCLAARSSRLLQFRHVGRRLERRAAHCQVCRRSDQSQHASHSWRRSGSHQLARCRARVARPDP